MKKILLATLLGFAVNAYATAEVKRVCHEVNGKQVCKNIKVHKKVEGTKVPKNAPAKKKK